ncbi:DUF4232 domain-containing protein [Streptomyces sp. NPDC058045]|uniref:DUF4232 domain-containing protein n=1 Tax=Streptomyces sp. NPDC058045 TaxID=3346311 RepID=UPI0036EC7939
MKYTRTAALAALGVATALSLTACGTSDSGTGTSAKNDSASSSSSSSGGSSDTSDTAKGDTTGGSNSGGSDSGGGSSSGGGKAGGAKTGTEDRTEPLSGSKTGSDTGTRRTRFCKVQDLDMNARDAKPDLENGNVIVTMTNTSSRTCSVTGFPGVDLTDADHTTSPLTRDDNQPRIADLKPGQNGVFNISYKISKGGEPGESNPVEIQVTPPNDTRHVTLHWPSGAIKGMSNATARIHPMHSDPMPPQ